MKLKYLFEVEYVDGSKFAQTADDVSKLDPKRSAYYDVLHIPKDIKKFHLKRWFDVWSIDLTTGVFTHNGVNFQIEENPIPVKRTLEFFRQHQHDMTATGIEKDHRVVYFLGYKAKRKKYLVGIK